MFYNGKISATDVSQMSANKANIRRYQYFGVSLIRKTLLKLSRVLLNSIDLTVLYMYNRHFQIENT